MTRHDPRFQTLRWQHLRRKVLARDESVCVYAADCRGPAVTVIHVPVVSTSDPDEVFFDPDRLKSLCAAHNWGICFGRTWVGERGPETFVPEVAGRVLSQAESMAMAAPDRFRVNLLDRMEISSVRNIGRALRLANGATYTVTRVTHRRSLRSRITDWLRRHLRRSY